MSIKRVKGFTLIEVLVSIVVLAIGLLGLAGLQLVSLKGADSAYYRSQASILADDVMDRMRSNKNAAIAGSYDTAIGESVTGGTIFATDLANWKSMLDGNLPAGDGSVAVSGGVVKVTIQWDDTRGGGVSTQQFVLESEL